MGLRGLLERFRYRNAQGWHHLEPADEAERRATALTPEEIEALVELLAFF